MELYWTRFDHSCLNLLSLIIWSCVFWPSITWNLPRAWCWSKSILTFNHYHPHLEPLDTTSIIIINFFNLFGHRPVQWGWAGMTRNVSDTSNCSWAGRIVLSLVVVLLQESNQWNVVWRCHMKTSLMPNHLQMSQQRQLNFPSVILRS